MTQARRAGGRGTAPLLATWRSRPARSTVQTRKRKRAGRCILHRRGALLDVDGVTCGAAQQAGQWVTHTHTQGELLPGCCKALVAFKLAETPSQELLMSRHKASVAETRRARAARLSYTSHFVARHAAAPACTCCSCSPPYRRQPQWHWYHKMQQPREAAPATAAHLTHRRQVSSGRLAAARVGPTRPRVVPSQAAGMRCGGAIPGLPQRAPACAGRGSRTIRAPVPV